MGAYRCTARKQSYWEPTPGLESRAGPRLAVTMGKGMGMGCIPAMSTLCKLYCMVGNQDKQCFSSTVTSLLVTLLLLTWPHLCWMVTLTCLMMSPKAVRLSLCWLTTQMVRN